MYSPTVNLPLTDFNIRAMAKEKEPEIQSLWDSIDVYNKLVSKNSEPFTLHDGPPYANGDLHIGHALNKIIKDIINKRKLLEGYKVKFVPGWDTHGLPIELKVRLFTFPSPESSVLAYQGCRCWQLVICCVPVFF